MMQATAEITEDVWAQRRAVRDRLKAAVKQASGRKATVLCMMISHMRGKLHCQSYQKYHGGWRSVAQQHVEAMRARNRFEERLGPGQERKWTEYLFASSVIDTLDDQAAFLRKFLDEEAVQRRRYEEVTQNGRRKPYVWETPMFDEELCNICKEVSAT
jgi:hypothetical protein